MMDDRSALAWLVAMGADEAVLDAPVDRFRAPAPVAASAPATMRREAPAPAPPPASRPAELSAREIAQRCNSLEELRAAVMAFDGCSLKATATNTVFADGTPAGRVMFIGEAPGADEDRRGEPFVGRAGELLTKMIAGMDERKLIPGVKLDRSTVYIANVLKCRPPGNRDPKPDEVASCLPYLARQVALVEPAIILAVGRIAAQNLLGSDAPLARLRGHAHHFGPAGTPLVVTYHPAYLLRSPGEKRKAWDDLKLARSLIDGRRAG